MFRLFSRTAIGVLLIFILTFSISQSVVSIMPPDGDSTVVWIPFTSQVELEILASRLDIWEVNHDRGKALAMISPEDAKWLSGIGFTTSQYPAVIPRTDSIPDNYCYRTIDEQYNLVDSLAQDYPQLTRVYTIGYSYEGRELRVVQLTNTLTSGQKPVFFLMANIHGRELISNETALDFVQYILVHYSFDPDVTWLMNHHIIYVLVSANPDGHVKNEPGEPWTLWRKNTHPYGICSGSSYGVDLNRNAFFMWGDASSYPCDELYQGPEPVSEPETSAIADFIRTIFPISYYTGSGVPAPDDTQGIFITLHSYGNMILWPWSYSYYAAPNAAQLAMLGNKLASFNGYSAKVASSLYPASGTTLDYVYGETGIASFLFEIGTGEDGFYPDCARYDALIEPNIQALLYAAKVARFPYITAFGPDIVDLTLIPSITTVSTSVVISATASDTLSGNQDISAVGVSIDTPPWDAGALIELTATDLLFDTPVESVYGILKTEQLEPGRHLVYVRGKDSAGYWGPVSAAYLDVIFPTFELNPQHVIGYASPGQTLTYLFSLTNTSAITQAYWMTASVSVWETHFTPLTATLAPKEQCALNLVVSIPMQDALSSDQLEDWFILTATTSTMPSFSHASYIKTRVLRYSAYTPLLLRDD